MFITITHITVVLLQNSPCPVDADGGLGVKDQLSISLEFSNHFALILYKRTYAHTHANAHTHTLSHTHTHPTHTQADACTLFFDGHFSLVHNKKIVNQFIHLKHGKGAKAYLSQVFPRYHHHTIITTTPMCHHHHTNMSPPPPHQ